MAGRPVFSKLLVSIANATQDVVSVYQNPPGFVTVVRSMSITNWQLYPIKIQGFRVYDEINNTIWFQVLNPFAVAGQTYLWEGRQVLEGPDGIAFEALDPNWGVRISGYQLTVT